MWEKYSKFAASVAKGKPFPRAFKRASIPLEITGRNVQKRKQILGKVSAAGTKGAHGYWKEET